MNTLSIVFVLLLISYFIAELWLGLRHIKHIRNHSKNVPDEFAQNITLEEHQKSAKYSIAKKKFALFNAPIALALLLFWTLGGGFEFFDNLVRGFAFNPILTGVVFLLAISFVMSLIDLPASWYLTFKLEERFGFNRTTVKIFFSDLIKGWLVGLIIGIPLLLLVLWLMQNSGNFWWLWVWATWLGFSLLMMWIYPTIIAPLFNKFTPLENEQLNSVINKLLARTGFNSNGIFIMDGSKRSGHGNAYFTGFGKSKRIVFFDTLLNTLNNSEIEAVLAHELGHFKHNHIKKSLALMATISLFGLWLLAFLIDKNWFYQGLGISQKSDYAALILFMSTMPIFTFFITPLFSWLSRKNEYQADEYASVQADGRSLVSALVNMYKDNASTLTPDPIHSLVYDSHPPAPLRIKHILGVMSSNR